MPQTQFNKFTFPNEDNIQAFWTMFEGYIQEIDTAIWQLKNNAHAMLFGGGTLTWAAGSGLLQWTDDFIVTLPLSGFVLSLRYGPDGSSRGAGIPTGSFLAVQLPTIITDNLTKNMYTGSTLEHTEGQFIVAYNYGGTLRLRNGTTLT